MDILFNIICTCIEQKRIKINLETAAKITIILIHFFSNKTKELRIGKLFQVIIKSNMKHETSSMIDF